MDGLWLLLTFVMSFIVTFATTPFVKELAKKIGAVDVPKDERRVHKKAMPLMGGLAIFYGFIVAVMAFCKVNMQVRGLVFGALIIVSLGIVDDIRPLSAKTKLVFQIIAALVVTLHGVLIYRITVPEFIAPSGYFDFGFMAIPITIIWIVGVTNALNLIDGIDGLAAGVSSISSMTIFCIALIVSETNIAIITAALAGACFGFLPYNFNPAKIFMGDTGSMFLGFTLATVSVMGLFKGYAVISVAVPFLVLGLPLFDTGFAIVRRIVNHKPIMSPDRGHLHHRLLDLGISQKQSVGILYLMSVMLGICAVVFVGSGAVRALVLLAILIGTIAFAAHRMNMHEKTKQAETMDVAQPTEGEEQND